MAITHAGTSFGSHIHGTPRVEPWEFDETRQHFFGLIGEYKILGKVKGREIAIPFHLTGYATHLLLQTGIQEFAILQGTTGTLSVEIGSSTSTYDDTTFYGFFPIEDPWLDGSGVNGWQQRGNLKFRQKGQ
jgi:hypothetical protein